MGDTCWYRSEWKEVKYYELPRVAQCKGIYPLMKEKQETRVQSLGQEDPLEEEMATHSSILAWKIPRTEEPGRLQSTGLQKVGHNSVT